MTVPPVVLPISGTVDPGFLAGLAALNQGLASAGEASERAGDRAREGGSRWTEAAGSIRRAADTYNEVRAAIDSIASTVMGAANRIAALATEQGRLDEMSARLGLNFDQAAAAAGRFADETEAMGAAGRFAAADIRLSQTELDALMRVAGSASAVLGTDTAGAVQQLQEALIRGREGGLQRFGSALAEVAGGSHTLQERLDALVVQSHSVAAATDTASDRMRRFADTIEDGQRTMATAFVGELARLSELGAGLDDRTSDADEFKRALEAAGQTAASMVTRVVLGVGIIGGSIATVLGGLTGMVQLAAAATHGLAAFNAERDRLAREGLSAESWRFVQSATARLEAMDAADGPQSTRDAPTAPAAPPPAAAVTADRAVRTRRTAAGGGGGARAAREPAADMVFTEAQRDADRLAEIDAMLGINRVQSADTAARAVTDGLIREEEARQTAQEMAQAHADKERDRLDRQREAHEQYTGRLAELYATQADAAGLAASSTQAAFSAMGTAIGDHILAIAAGRETIAQGLQGMLADTLAAVAKEAAVKGAMETAAGIGALAGIVTAPMAPGHFAAAGAYFGVAALAGVASAAVAPSAPAAASARGGAGAGGAGGILTDRPANDNARGGDVYNISYHAPIIDGRGASDADVGEHIDRYRRAARGR